MGIEDVITDPGTGKPVYKSAFTSFFHGTQALQIVTRIANGFGAHICDVPANRSAREQMIQECDIAISETKPVVDQTKKAKLQVLRAFYQQVTSMKSFVKSELVVSRTLNMFKPSPQAAVLVADCWIPEYATDIVREALDRGSNSSTLNSSAD